ncbi:MAG: molybdopterin molybdotransferase MoeA, partial [Planctomycetota bacterium]
PYAFDPPDAAIENLADRLAVVGVENTNALTGRVLAADLRADRDSPAANVSAMDGYAVRVEDLKPNQEITVSGVALPGAPPLPMADQAVTQIFTGALVPADADAVVKREDTIESDGVVRFLEPALSTKPNSNIRFAGENLRRGEVFLSAGCQVKPAQAAAATNFGVAHADVFSKVRLAILTTGDELPEGPVDAEIDPWQIRNSNRTALMTMMDRFRWIASPTVEHVNDSESSLRDTMVRLLANHDALLLTGGVSAGDHDYVPGVVRGIGAEVVFHKLPLRPGKPILGAATDEGKLILGLPGNPVSATMGCRRFAIPLLAKQSGRIDWSDRPTVVKLVDSGQKTLPLHWMRGVKRVGVGTATPVIGQGSGDLVALARTDGFVEMPPNATGEGPWPYWDWTS